MKVLPTTYSQTDLLKRASFPRLGEGSNPVDRNNIDFQKVNIQGPRPAPERAQLLIQKAIETQGFALKSQQQSPNYSGFHVAAMVELSNGKWYSAGNVELNREITLCGERVAILSALENLKQAPLQDEIKVKTVLVGNNQRSFKKLCADCLSWLATDKYFSPDTQVVSVQQDKDTNQLALKIRSLKDVIPFHLRLEKGPATTDRPIAQLPVAMSAKASEICAQKHVSLEQLVNLVEKAQKAFESQSAKRFSAKPAAAVVQFKPFGKSAGIRFEWAPRFSESEDLHAIAAGIQRVTRVQNTLGKMLRILDKAPFEASNLKQKLGFFLNKPTIEAIAYYGEDNNLPPLVSIGRMVKQGAKEETLIAKIENNTVQIRTLGEYMTEIYGL